ncbi:MAG: diphosphomevalonate decarboxylase [Myxococcota bacterium]
MPVATAAANIALVKYWGKRENRLNLPARGSLSLTLDSLRTYTQVELDPSAAADSLSIDGAPKSGRALERVTELLDLLRAEAKPELQGVRARVVSRTTFPVAAGLASSASGFAALTVAGAAAYQLSHSAIELSAIARRGSGSAARSLFGGFVRMEAGRLLDGSDAAAHALGPVPLELGAAITVVDAEEKEVGSTDGMELTRNTSPYHRAWLDLVVKDLARAEAALKKPDFQTLAEIVEGNCLAMHADAMAARPGLIYFKAATLWAIEQVRAMRKRGLPVMFTIDAGPHLVAFAPPAHLEEIASQLAKHPDIKRVIISKAGEGAQLIQAFPAEIPG